MQILASLKIGRRASGKRDFHFFVVGNCPWVAIKKMREAYPEGELEE
jgi:hypothetical protein